MQLLLEDKKLYFHITKRVLDKVRIHKIPFRLTGHRGFTIGNHIFTIAPEDKKLIAHELVHVEQYMNLGVLRFLYRYFKEYRSLRKDEYGKNEAYRNISFEREAYDAANDWQAKQNLK